jgi:integrase
MPRKARDERLDTRTARLKLRPRREPYWRNIQEGRAIGYRRLAGGKAGTWIARHYDPAANPPRRYEALGTADDLLEADGTGTLNFAQAQDRAREWFASLTGAPPKLAAPITVREAWEHYRPDYLARGGKALNEMEWAVEAHILPKLGERRVIDLTTAEIRAWHHSLANAPARRRTAKEAKTRNVRVIAADDKDGRRARRATANNLLTRLKAILNTAYGDELAPTNKAWRDVKPFPKVVAARVRYLTDDEATRLVNASPHDLRELITAALLTGCRYQELARLRCEDVDLRNGTLTIREAKGGDPRHPVLTEEAGRFFGQKVAGRRRSDLVLPRDDGSAWARSAQFRPLREACKAANIQPPIGFHILRHTHGSRLAMKGVPMQIIAHQLGHADLRITAKHYAHLAPSHVADTIRAAFGSLGLVPDSNVTALR